MTTNSNVIINKSVYRRQPVFKKPIGPQMTPDQTWVNMQVELCKRDTREAMLFPPQAFMHPLALYRQWNRFNTVLNLRFTTMPTIVAKALGIGSVAWIGLFALFLIYGLSDLPADQRFLSIIVMFFASLSLGLGLAWVMWTMWAYAQCYIRTYIAENLDYSNPGDCANISRVFLPRLVFLNRPDVFRGNDGANGILHKHAIVRLQSNFGQSVAEITDISTYYDLPADEYGMRDAEASDIYNLYHLASSGGHSCSTFNDPEQNKMQGFFTTNWPWFISGGMLILAFYLAFSSF